MITSDLSLSCSNLVRLFERNKSCCCCCYIIQLKDTLKTFIKKLDSWKRKVRTNNVAMFEELSSILKVDDEEHVLADLEKELIWQHL